MVSFQEYDSERYNSIHSLKIANNLFDQANAEDVINTKICVETYTEANSELFIKHNLYKTYGVTLLHRHFDMDPDEKLVENGAVSTPWAYHQDSDAVYGGSVVPRSWVYSTRDRNLYPYEFGYNAQGAQTYPAPPDNPEFLAEFCGLLEEHGLVDLLGLTVTSPKEPGVMKFEKTFKRANIVFNLAEDTEDEINGAKHSIKSLWNFGSMQPNASNGYRTMWCAIACKCFE